MGVGGAVCRGGGSLDNILQQICEDSFLNSSAFYSCMIFNELMHLFSWFSFSFPSFTLYPPLPSWVMERRGNKILSVAHDGIPYSVVGLWCCVCVCLIIPCNCLKKISFLIKSQICQPVLSS